MRLFLLLFAAQAINAHSTLIDALGADKDFELLLGLIQKARLVPTFNKLNGSTFFAPTNDAIKRRDDPLWDAILNNDHFVVTDNVREELRQQLFYHTLNDSISGLPDEERHPKILRTLHYPHKPLDPPSRLPPPYPPWMPIPSGTLGNEPQRLRMARRNQKGWVGVDAMGNGGVEVVKDLVDAGNGVLFGISDMLDPPPDLAAVISAQQSLSYFSRILTPEAIRTLNSTSKLTLFLPVDEAWDALKPYERIYLESEFATDDLRRILNMHAVMEKTVKWSDSFASGLKRKFFHLTSFYFKSADGATIEIVQTPKGTKVSDGDLVQPDVYAANGVLHLVSSLLIPEGSFSPTPEKYLLALNCTSFVSMLHSVNLTHLINDTDAKYTILAPKDDVLSLFGDSELPEKGSTELKKMLQYHFMPGHWTQKKLRDGMLLETELEEEGLKGGRQVVSVDVNESSKGLTRSVQFAGASAIGEPILLDNVLVYFMSRPLVPPSDPISTALPSLDLSSFLAAILSSNQSEILKTTPRTSLLLPYNSAFKRLGLLVSAHLLSPSSKPDLEKVILHHTLSTVQYSQNLVNGSQQTFSTLEGSDIKLERISNGTVLVSSSGGWPGMRSRLVPKNTLTQTGVIHELTDILLPRSVDITIGKLVRAAKGSTMANLVNRAGFDWVLNGTAPPEGSEWAEKFGSMNGGGVGWTLLCPMDDAFKHYNLTKLFADPEQLKNTVMQHLIPFSSPNSNFLDNGDGSGGGGDGGKGPGGGNDEMYNNQPLVLENTASYSTLRSPNSAYGDIVFRTATGDDGEKGFIVGIKDARGTNGKGDWAKVVSWGRATTSGFAPSVPGPALPPDDDDEETLSDSQVIMSSMAMTAFVGGAAGGVIQIDRLLSPYEPPWWIAYGAPTFVGVVGVMVICAFFYGVRVVWGWDTTEATYEPSEEKPQHQKVSAAENIKSFIAGGFGGAAAVLVGHPFDLTKTRLQTAAPGAYTGAIDVVKKTLAKDGITGLYRGMVPPLLGITPIFAVSFWAYDASKQLIFALTPDRTTRSLSTAELATAGFLSAVPTTLITAPVERAKVLLQVQGQGAASEVKYKGVTDVLRHLYKEGGVRSIYRGTGATLARDGPGSAAYFAAYEVTKKFLTPAGSSPADLNLGAIILAGGTAGVAMWAIAIPPDVLKSRLQSAPTGTYSGIIDCARKTIAADGIGALWKGFGPAMARAFPANAATFLGVEASRKLLDGLF
ncbi:carnitine/acyl carnitine carrier [Macrolepiota fuliginosa MF-IS2]|uniref:Carnitine/acyl carnitine carrier n=1 Tax=Macrolepiota fuliginosa MF-IS2 TaxID=1400762 RepID=A0A9P5XP19_9AGAR|nr:carnitine/acyl carnitine carrier [Macrolepiota fuliginosa MF-IS2]